MCDGDKALVIKDNLLVKIAKRNMEGVVPLYYEMKKAQGSLITPDSLYKGMAKAYVSGNIGPISNLITIVHNNSQKNREEALKAVKWLVMETNFTIDSSKTLFFLKRPEYADKIIKKHTKAKLPNFFIYAKDKTERQVEKPNNSTMNRIAAKIPDPKLKFNKTMSKLDYHMLMNFDEDFSISPDSQVIKSYDYWNLRTNSFSEDKGIKNQEMYKYHNLRQKVIEESGKSIDYIVNTLVAFLYTNRKQSVKKGLWDAFGDVILKNLEKNVGNKGRICVICGKRFEPNRKDQIGCSKECRKKINVIKQRDRDRALKLKKRNAKSE